MTKLHKNPICILILLFFINNAYAKNWWGAIYMDTRTGVVGGSYDAGSRELAKNTAFRSCVKNNSGRLPKRCQLVTSFASGCAAVYWSPVNGRGGFGSSDYQLKRAEIKALNACEDAGGRRCQRRISFCTTRLKP